MSDSAKESEREPAGAPELVGGASSSPSGPTNGPPGRAEVLVGAIVLLCGLGFLGYLIVTGDEGAPWDPHLVSLFVALVVAVGAGFLGGGATVSWTLPGRLAVTFVGGVGVFAAVTLLLFKLYVPSVDERRQIEITGEPSLGGGHARVHFSTSGVRDDDNVKACLGAGGEIVRCIDAPESPVLLGVNESVEWIQLLVEDSTGEAKGRSERYKIPRKLPKE